VGREGGLVAVSMAIFGLESFELSPVKASSALRLTPTDAAGMADDEFAVELR
jgi:hypothetical protein